MAGGRVRRKIALVEAAERAGAAAPTPAACALCGRPLGTRTEWHHVVPRSEGGTETEPVHPICHRTIHATVSNADLARVWGTLERLREQPGIAAFLRWVADKPPDFHAPTRRRRG